VVLNNFNTIIVRAKNWSYPDAQNEPWLRKRQFLTITNECLSELAKGGTVPFFPVSYPTSMEEGL